MRFTSAIAGNPLVVLLDGSPIHLAISLLGGKRHEDARNNQVNQFPHPGKPLKINELQS
jgi:hypothetical protein